MAQLFYPKSLKKVIKVVECHIIENEAKNLINNLKSGALFMLEN